MPITRLHDAPLENSGLNLVDVPMIFPLFHADVNDPRNYNFKATDDYLANCIACGTEIFYRLGVSIDHSYNKYNITPPPDTAKWIEIVSHIIDHYNNGWANGFHYNIKYWEIWNEAEGINGGEEPHLHTMWNAPVETYYAFYVEVAKALKAKYPDLKIGGPSNCQWHKRDNRWYGGEFLHCVKDSGAPLDFYSYHVYANSLNWVSQQLTEIRDTLDSLGFEKTEIHITEWAYCPENTFARLRLNGGRDAAGVYAEKASVSAGAFIAYAMIVMQELPVDMTYYYTVTTTAWGLYDIYNHRPTKAYFGLKSFGDLAYFYSERIEIKTVEFEGEPLSDKSKNNDFGFGAIGGRDADGNLAVLVANYRYGESHVKFDLTRLDKFSRAELLCLDENQDLSVQLALEPASGILEFETSGDSSVHLLKLWK
ncbi:MAG: hypothetical protein PHI35_08500 [Victivallaceae bacterium]|nr:hypothetical protein [Victivallaceae bacterium]